MTSKISQLTAAGTLTGAELIEVSQPSTTVTLTASTISALASDNSINDSAAGFVTAGFAMGDQVRIQGFTGNVVNNLFSARITALTAGKMTFGGTDGDVIVDDAAGESVTVTKWVSRRATATEVAALGGGGGGGGGSTQGRHAVHVTAGAMVPSLSGGCASLNRTSTSGNQPDIVSLDFDPVVTESAQFALVMPRKWNEGTVTFRAHWSHSIATTNFGVAWLLQAVAIGDDDPIAATYGTAQRVTDTGGTTNDFYTTAESAVITIAGTPQPEDCVFFRIYRDPSDVADTLAIDARLLGITLYITTNADTDA